MSAKLPTELFAKHQLVSDLAERLTYETDAGFDKALPDGVFYPESVEDTQRIVRWASEHHVPIVARGAGTGLSGGAIAEHGGVVIVQSRMSRILDIDTTGRTVTVEAGAVNLEMAAAAGRAGFTYPPDPSSGRTCCIGGNIGTNAGGPHCFKYGVTTNYVAGVEAVLADGSSVKLGGDAVDSPEIDLRGLVVGSEGTLGVVTRATLRLLREPPAVETLMVSFASLEAAGNAVSALIAAGLVPATLEAIDRNGMRVIEDFCAAGLPVEAGAVLIVEIDGYAQGLAVQLQEVASVLEQHGGFDLHVAANEAERQRIWYGRKSAAGAMARLAPSYYLTDVTVRRSRLAAVLGKVKTICDRYDLKTANFFHAGDGNLHPLIPGDPQDPTWVENVHQAVREIIDLCVQEDGSITGEHGIGLEKRADMLRMYGGAELSAMRDVKSAFDPQNLLNPGKVLPDEIPEPRLAGLRTPAEGSAAPDSAEEAAGILRALSREGKPVALSNAETGSHGGATFRISTSNLKGIRTFAPEDLFLTVGAGTPLAEIERFLQPHSLRVPLASPWSDTTAGGLVATNLNAPLRLRYGSVRDVTLCATVALADGRVIRAGRPLVKNVAGYDLIKAFVGSHGTLGLLTDVTFKLIPAPRIRRTLAIPVNDLDAGLALAHRALGQALTASAIVFTAGDGHPAIDVPGKQLLYTAEGMPEEVEAELTEVLSRLDKDSSTDVAETSLSGTEAWAATLSGADSNSLIVRIGLPAKQLENYAKTVTQGEGRFFYDVAASLIYGILDPDHHDHARSWLADLRQPALEVGGYAVGIRIPSSLSDSIDPWGYPSDALTVSRRLKVRWDPAGILGPIGFLPIEDSSGF